MVFVERGSHPEAKVEAGPLPGALRGAWRAAGGRQKPALSLCLPPTPSRPARFLIACCRPIYLCVTVPTISYLRSDQQLDRLPRGLGRQRPRSKEAATVRRSVPGARRCGHARPTFSVDGAQIDTNIAAAHRSTLTGCSASANGRRRARTKKRSALAAAAWPRARRRRHTNTTKAQPTQPCDRAARSQARVTTTKR